jgi:hypothetical protein
MPQYMPLAVEGVTSIFCFVTIFMVVVVPSA